jgi:prophage regulatory protein
MIEREQNMQARTVSQKTELTRFIKMPKVLELTQMGRTTLWRLVKNGKFPKPIHIGPNSVAWREGDYEAWAANPEAWNK